MSAAKFLYRLTISPKTLDLFGHVNHARYVEMFEDARWDMLDKRGYGQDVVREENKGPIVVDLHIEFRKEILVGDTIEIETYKASERSRTVTFHQIMRSQNGVISAEAWVESALLDMQTRKMIRPTERWARAMQEPTV